MSISVERVYRATYTCNIVLFTSQMIQVVHCCSAVYQCYFIELILNVICAVTQMYSQTKDTAFDGELVKSCFFFN